MVQLVSVRTVFRAAITVICFYWRCRGDVDDDDDGEEEEPSLESIPIQLDAYVTDTARAFAVNTAQCLKGGWLHFVVALCQGFLQCRSKRSTAKKAFDDSM